MAKLFATIDPNPSSREKRNMNRAREIATQGMVLLENRGALPIPEATKKIALFGNGGRRTVKGGSGSGDVNSRCVVTVEQGLEEAGFTITTKEWLSQYDMKVEKVKNEYFEEVRKDMLQRGYIALLKLSKDPYMEPPISCISEEECCKADTDTAVYVLARSSGEGLDRKPIAGDYELYEEEKDSISILTEYFKRVIIVLNVGGVIDTKYLRNKQGIGAVLLMSQAGNVGGYALVDILTGKVTPSGHLTTTWANNYCDYPNAEMFSHMNGDVDDEYYREGIYVGYRYFDTFNVTPAYPFGYGLSYTDFLIETEDVHIKNNEISVRVKVSNTGSGFSGKEVVQVFYSAPSGILEKPYQELVAYAKTKELRPGESEIMTISYPAEQMASYDTKRAAFVMEDGTYYVRVGNQSRNTKVVAAIELNKEVITEVLSNRLNIDCKMEELTAKGITPYSYENEEMEKKNAIKLRINADEIPRNKINYNEENPQLMTHVSGKKITLPQVARGKATLDELVGQLTIEEMADLCMGTARDGLATTSSEIGAEAILCPGASGDTSSKMIDDRNIRNMVLSDGPAGLHLSRHFKADINGNMIQGSAEMALSEMALIFKEDKKLEAPEGAIDYYQYCTAIPIATLLAQTWDLGTIKNAGEIIGEEMMELGVTLLLGPGMNIQRNPLCGRNYEYYSEDPLVSGMCAAADTLGVQKYPGIGTTIKHFICNNQEDNRMHMNSHVSERTLREIYLKGFEIAVKVSQPMSIMTSYNMVNGTHTANSKDLITIARNEWGFAGVFMTDFGTTGGEEMKIGLEYKYGCSSAAACIKAGNDFVMPGKQEDLNEIIQSVDSTGEGVVCSITKGELQACTKRILNIIMRCSSYEGAVPYVADRTGLEGYIKVVM